jgi:hypothetical protein
MCDLRASIKFSLQAELDRARAELEQYNGVTANAVMQADQQEAATLRAASRCTVLGHYATGRTHCPSG